VTDTGALDDGADTLTINGTGEKDVFLLREKFVAYLTETETDTDGRPIFATEVERINYDSSINGRLTVTSGLGDDQFYVDDNSTITTLDGGQGKDLFQIGQVFGTNPNGWTYANGDIDPKAVAPGDEIELLQITRGWLSQGINYAMTVFGGEGGDTFNVYSNKAVLRLEGESGNDNFVIRAFIAKDSIIANGGGDDDYFEYNINAPVSINGGLGFDTVVAIGTEMADAFIITDEGIFGAGLNIRLDGVEEAIEVDGLEGDDTFYIMSTRDKVITTVIGGLGSDTFNIAGDVTKTVISQDLNGRSSVINQGTTSNESNPYDKLLVDGVAVAIADVTQGKVLITESDGYTELLEDSGATDSYTISLVRPTAALDSATVAYLTVSAGISSSYDKRLDALNIADPHEADSVLVSIDNGATWQRAAVLTFTTEEWEVPQTVLVKAAHDDTLEGERKVMISHSLMVVSPSEADKAAFNAVAIPNVEVRVLDDDLGTLLIRESDNSTRVLEGSATSEISDTYQVKLSVIPTGQVTVNLGFDSSQVRVYEGDMEITSLTFGAGADEWRTITVKAVQDTVRENTGIARITHSFDDATTDPVYASALDVELDVKVFDDDSARVLVTESDGSTRVVMNGEGDDYTLRLVSNPGAPVYVNLYGDGQTVFTGAQTVGLSDARLIEDRNLGDAQTLTVEFAANGADADTITMTGMSWTDAGFSIGTLFSINGGTTLKVNNITDTMIGDTVVSTLTLTTGGDVPAEGTQTVSLQRKTFAVVFDSTNWWQEVSVSIEADSNFVADPDQLYVRHEPVREHVVNSISGPLIIEGGVAEGKDRSIRPAVMLPTEATGLPKDISVLTDETQQADRLNVFNDSSTADDIGWMEATTLDNDVVKLGAPINISGLGMRPGLDGRSTSLTVDISEDQGGSNLVTFWGGITFDDIEITEIMLGQGNDTFTIDATSAGTPGAEGFVVTVVHGGGNSYLTNADGHYIDAEGELTDAPVIGGDTIIVTGGGGPDSPLVIYGDTAQDGRRYDSRPDLNIFTGNAMTFINPGNDVIDASAISESVTIYGGAGNDVIYGSQAGDHLAGGSGDDLIYGYGGNDHIYGDSGFNFAFDVTVDDEEVHRVARELTVVTLDTGIKYTRDGLVAGEDKIYGGAGNDIIFGDLGVVDQSSLKLLSTGNVTEIRSEQFSNGEADSIEGGSDNDIILGGNKGDGIHAGEGNNIVLGDEGWIKYNLDGNLADIDLIESLSTIAEGGADMITTGAGNDIVIGGRFGDEINAGSGDNLVIGDSGRITAASADAPQFDGIPMTYGRIETIAFGDGGSDTITTGSGSDIILGGHNDGDGLTVETITAGDGNNIVIGDDGKIDYTRADRESVAGADASAADIDLIESTSTTEFGGVDKITTGSGSDLIIGGRYGDTIEAGNGNNLVIGDSGRITAASADAPQFGVAMTYGLIETVAFGDGGVDTITTLDGNDIVLGGHEGDIIHAGEGNNIVLGDDGKIDYTRADRESFAGADTNPADIDLIESTSTTQFGGVDEITTGAGNDVIIGGRFSDTIIANAGNNLVIGDSGRITADEIDTKRWPGQLMSVGKVETIEPADGGADTITTLGGDDIILGGTDSDTIHAGDGIDVIFGDQGEVRSYVTGGGNYVVTYGTETVPWFEDYYYLATSIDNDQAGADDLIYGEGGRDYILGQQGADVIFGGSGDDDIYGGHNVATGHDTGDFIDGGTGNDVIAGDNASIQGTDAYVSPRFRALEGTVIYDSNGNVQVTPTPKSDPNQVHARTVILFDSAFNDSPNYDANTFGNDLIAGGADDDVIFGQIGNDTLHGDGQISDPGLTATTLDYSQYVLSALLGEIEGSDIGGDDYVEGNGGDDTIYGGLGQDDLIGGNSSLFGLTRAEQRPDGSDTIYGGNGVMLDRNNMGDTSTDGHARDADMILGDNGNIYRLVGTNGTGTGQYLTFNYDNYGTMKIVSRAAELIDYTPGGPDYNAAAAAHDIGAADTIHGESGDDFIYGMKGNDVLYGEGQDDDLIGGYGNDWISGGTGSDGVLGDDGRIYTSRNSTAGEPLYGVVGLSNNDPDTRYNNGTVLNEFIYTPGKIQQSTINVAGELKKSVNITPFNLDPLGAAGGIEDPLFDPQHADDIIYGGWGDDFLHGGAGDDAISGAEALPEFYNAHQNLGNVLGYGDAKVWGDPAKAGEFAWYDEYNPLAKIAGFLLNFDATEGPTAGTRHTDGDDAIFGDLGNDWIVGGTGRDHLYGGYGDDLLNADDDLETAGGLNNAPDTDPSYEDIAYGGAGRDVLIANTGGDRLIDWAGEFNSYLVPFAPYGMATISRTIQPQLPEYLYALSMSDGADVTRAADTGNDAVRNGEPDGELGLVKQKDAAWQDQTGAPADPQAGNIAGGKRDVLRSASFNSGSTDMFAVDSGLWTVASGRYQVAPESLGGDALAVFNVDKYIPSYFEMLATIRAVKPVAGYDANAYLVFDYQSATDFKFAGINVSTSKLEIGYRDETGWHVVMQTPYTGALKADTDYSVLLALNGSTATLVVNNKITMTYSFTPRVDGDGFEHFLNEGMVGIGANNAKGQIDNVIVQRIAPETTLERTVAFTTDPVDRDIFNQLFQTPDGGNWQVKDGRYVGENSVDLVNLSIAPAYVVELSASLKTGGQGGFVFDYYGPQDYKFVTVSVETGQVLIGHSTAKTGLVVNATWNSAGLSATTDYGLGVTLMGSTVSVTLNNQGVLSYAFNALVTDGQFGLFANGGEASFDNFKVRTDDPAFIGSTPVLPTLSVSDVSVTEGDSGSKEAVLTFTLSAASTVPVSIDYRTLDGTALAGEDYQFAQGTLTFAPGETSKQIAFSVIGDTLFEPDETFTVQLSTAVGATIDDGSGKVTIVNNDVEAPAEPTISISDASVLEGSKTNKTKVTVTISLSQAATAPVTVHLATENGTAVVGSDYVAASTTITFAAGEREKVYTLTVNGDKVGEFDEWFGVRLSSAVGAKITDNLGVVTILNDDGAAMTAVAAPADHAAGTLISEENLNVIVSEAIDRWSAVVPDAAHLLENVNFQIGDFTGLTLGIADGNNVFIDADAAGYGWFIDSTPSDDLEFSQGGSEAAGRMDLLTVVMHELGHVLGYEDMTTSNGVLMSDVLSTGARYVPDDLTVAPKPASPASTLLNFRPPSNGIPAGWIFENASVAENSDADTWWNRLRQRLTGQQKAHDALPLLLNIREMAATGSMENGVGTGQTPVGQIIADMTGKNGDNGVSLGQTQQSWVSDFVLKGNGKADPNRNISISI
jgi:Ca2+-binding RTX toxin-like protein